MQSRLLVLSLCHSLFVLVAAVGLPWFQVVGKRSATHVLIVFYNKIAVLILL